MSEGMIEQRKEYYTHHDNGFKCIRCGYKWYNFDPCCEYPKKYQDHTPPELAWDVEKQIEYEAFNYMKNGEWKSSVQTHYVNGATEFYQRGLAVGEAKSVQWVLEFMMGEYARTGNFPGPSEISEEASRRNIKITKGE